MIIFPRYSTMQPIKIRSPIVCRGLLYICTRLPQLSTGKQATAKSIEGKSAIALLNNRIYMQISKQKTMNYILREMRKVEELMEQYSNEDPLWNSNEKIYIIMHKSHKTICILITAPATGVSTV